MEEQPPVNAAGWQGADGRSIDAWARYPETLEPGGPELRATAGASELVTAHTVYGGLTSMWAELAGETTRRHERLPPDWIARVERLALKSDTAEPD